MFVRYWSSTGTTGDVRFYMRISSGATTFTTRQAAVTVSSEWQVADLGRISLPLGPHLGTALSQSYMNFDLYVSNTPAAARVVDFMDVILMPVDEWFAFLSVGTGGYLTQGQELQIDSATRARQMLTSHSLAVGFPYIVYQWAPYTAGPLILQANTDQRLWYFSQGILPGVVDIAEPHYAAR